MGGFGSGRTLKAGRRPRNRRMTNELIRFRSFDLMNRRLEEEGLVSKASLFCQETEVAQLIVTPSQLKVYNPGEFHSENPVFSTEMRKEGCGAVKGYRFTFTCPCCQGRCIYLYWDGGCLGCQKCQDLMHPTQNMSSERRWYWKQKKFLNRYGFNSWGVSYDWKPKGMHEWKFKKLYREWCDLDTMEELISFSHQNYPLAHATLKEEDGEGLGSKRTEAYEMLGEYGLWMCSLLKKMT